MALQLVIGDIIQSNDAKTLTVYDDTGAYDAVNNTTGWGSPNTAFADIDGSTSNLSLQITVTTSDGTVTIYDAIDFYDLTLESPSDLTDLIFVLTPENLVADGVAMGTSTDTFVDGWYDFVYTIDKNEVGGTGSTYTTSKYKLISGIVRNSIYEHFLSVPFHSILAMPTKAYIGNSHELIFPLYLASLYEGMGAFLTESKKAEVLEQLSMLENLTS
jgi:hypothetical protein